MMETPRRIVIEVDGRHIPCYPTMGAMLLFGETTGKDVSAMDFNSVSESFTYMWCCATEASAREGVEFGMGLKEFARAVLPEDLKGWVESLSAAQAEEAGAKKKTPKGSR